MMKMVGAPALKGMTVVEMDDNGLHWMEMDDIG